MHRSARILAMIASLALAVPVALAQNGADLNISPKRLVFDPATRTATVFVFNRGTEAATYSVELNDRAMLPDGQIIAAEDAGTDAERRAVLDRVKSSKELITFTPRRVTLQPGSSQTIRVRVLRPADLPPGEYRSHLAVSTVPPEDTGLTAEQAAQPQAGQLAVRVVGLFSLSIPVIVRQGESGATAGLQNFKLSTADVREGDAPAPVKKAVLSFDLTRAGAGSVYGNLAIRSDKDAKNAAPLGGVRGIAVYPEIERRAAQVVLQRIPVSGERLTVTFTDDDRQPGAVLATGTFTVP